MPGQIHDFPAGLTDRSIPPVAPRRLSPAVLAVTADLRFYSNVLNAVDLLGWKAEWAPGITRATEVCRRRPVPIVVCDMDLPAVPWRWAFDALNAVLDDPRLLLAARKVDEDLWLGVIRRHGYDVVERSARAGDLSRSLYFAWLSLFPLGQAGLEPAAGPFTALPH